jgi:hypothetical protein
VRAPTPRDAPPLTDGALHPAPATVAAPAAAFMSGVAAVGDPPRPLTLLDPRAILGADVIQPLRAGRAA